MKKIFIAITLFTATVVAKAQDFKKQVDVAKTSYKAGKLEEAHFALQTMLQDLDITIGKEVIKLLPTAMDTLKVNSKEDNVSGNIGFVGATIHRSYGMWMKKAEIDIINNSPMLGALNAFLSTPFLANAGAADGTKVVKVQGYKSRLTKESGSENQSNDYRLEIPLNNALITLKVNSTSENEVLSMANTLPIEKIAKLIQ